MKLEELKQTQKGLAKSIKVRKGTRKQTKDGYVTGLYGLSDTYRHQHIAYCLARGRKIEEIERTCREDNHYDTYRVDQILKSIEMPQRESFIKEVPCE
jgi:hypothetical protein